MNVEQTKRMNLMIKELTKSGMVSSFADAVDTAAGLYEGAMPQDKNVSQVIEATRENDAPAQEAEGSDKEAASEQVETQPQQESQEPHPPSQPTLGLEEVQSCVQERIDANNQSIAKDLRSLYEEIKKVQSGYQQEIDDLKNQIKALKASRPSGQQELSQENEKQPEKKEGPENPRQGSYSPDAVVLENYFYYGNK